MSEYEDEFEYEYDDMHSGSSAAGSALEVENMYYEADDYWISNPKRSLELFIRLASQESPRNHTDATWKFKSLVKAIVLTCRLGHAGELAPLLDKLFSSMDVVSRNEAVDGVSEVLDALASPCETSVDILVPAYENIIDRLWEKGPSASSLWFGTAVRLSNLYLLDPIKHFRNLDSVVTRMQSICTLRDGSEDLNKSSQLLEVYAIEIQLLELQKGTLSRLKEIMAKCSRGASSAVSNPRTMAIIREHAGKILMSESRYEDAYTELFEAFRAYSDSGSPLAITSLKYAVLANMFSLSRINPFDSREAKAYEQDAQVAALASLRAAYDAKDVEAFEKVLEGLTDPFMRSHVDALLLRVKLELLELMCKAYMSVPIVTLQRRLKVTDSQTMVRMLMRLILDGKVDGIITGSVIKMANPEYSASGELQALKEALQFNQAEKL